MSVQDPSRALLFIVDDWTPVIRNTLRGFCKVHTPFGFIFHNVAVHKREGICWASPSSKPQMNRDGVQLRDAAGRGLWVPIVSFATKQHRDDFSASVIAALLVRYSEALTS